MSNATILTGVGSNVTAVTTALTAYDASPSPTTQAAATTAGALARAQALNLLFQIEGTRAAATLALINSTFSLDPSAAKTLMGSAILVQQVRGLEGSFQGTSIDELRGFGAAWASANTLLAAESGLTLVAP